MRSIDRRTFVEVAAGTASAVLCSACASFVATPVTPEDGKIRLPLRNYPALSQPGGHLKILPSTSATPLYVVHTDQEGFFTLSSTCTHLECTVRLEAGTFVCPCHGSTYDRSGLVLKGPAEQPLRRFPTVLSSDGILEIDLASEA